MRWMRRSDGLQIAQVLFSFLCVILEPQINLQTWMELHLGSDPLTETFYLSVLALESALSFNTLSAEKRVQ